MRRGVLILSLLLVAVSLRAAQIALVYESDAAVLAGKPTFGTVVPEGILVPATVAMAGGANLLVGQVGEKLRKGAIARLDNDLNLALIRGGDEVTNPALKKAFEVRSAGVVAFAPAVTAATAVLDSTSSAIAAASQSIQFSTGAFQVKINGKDVDEGVIELKSRLKKSKFKLELVSISTATVWRIDVELKSNPKLSFWKEGRKIGMNDVPTTTFEYTHQLMFAPMKVGKSFVVPVEVFFIEETDYEWTLKAKTKTDSTEKKIRVKFN